MKRGDSLKATTSVRIRFKQVYFCSVSNPLIFFRTPYNIAYARLPMKYSGFCQRFSYNDQIKISK